MSGREVEERKPVSMQGTEKKLAEAKRPNGTTRQATGMPQPFRGFRVTVHNLAPTVTWRDLKDFLRLAGEVRFADVVVPGLGIGEFGTPQERATVIRLLNGRVLKGNKVTIRHLNEMDPRFQGARPHGLFAHGSFPEPVPYVGAPGPSFEPPYVPGFEAYPYSGPAAGGPVFCPMEYPPIGFAPPPPRIPHWGQNTGRLGRGYAPFPIYPHTSASFPRGHVRPEIPVWTMPPAPPRARMPTGGMERPVSIPYSQPAPPLRSPEFVDPPEEPPYPRTPVPGPVFADVPPEGGRYDSRPTTKREYHSYTSAPYHGATEGREKPSTEYSGGAEEWNGYYAHHHEPQTDGRSYGKYDPPPPAEKPDSERPYPPYARVEDPRPEYPDRRSSLPEDSRKSYTKSGSYTGYWGSSSSAYPDPAGEPVVDKYDYREGHPTSEAYKYRIDEYHHHGEGYPSSDYLKKHRSAEYEYRAEQRYGSAEYSREYHDRRDYADRSHRDGDLRGAGGPERPRQRSSHRACPYDR